MNKNEKLFKTKEKQILLYLDLKSETSGDFKQSLEAMMMEANEFDAYSYNKAIAGLGTDGLLLSLFIYLIYLIFFQHHSI